MADQPSSSRTNLKKLHTIFWEIGLIATLLGFIIAMRADIPANNNSVNFTHEQIDPPVEITPPPPTNPRQQTPPPPENPTVQPPKPSDEPITEQLDIEEPENISSNEKIEIGPPSPPTPSGDEEKVFQVVEQQPELIGGLKALQKKVNYPASCRRANIEGRVTMQFIVNKKGDIENVEVLQGIGGGCDEAAIEALKKHAKFKPGRQRGNAVNVQYSLPIRFKLQ